MLLITVRQWYIQLFLLLMLCAFPLLSMSAEPWTVIASINGSNFQTKSNGQAIGVGWGLWSNGYVGSSVNFQTTAIYEFQVQAYGSVANNVWPIMELKIDDKLIKSFTVNSKSVGNYTIRTGVSSGVHNITISFTNDYLKPPQDRNLYVNNLKISTPNGIFPYQSVTIFGWGGLDFFGAGATCQGTGCRVIDEVVNVGGNNITINTVSVVTASTLNNGKSSFVSVLDNKKNYNSVSLAMKYALKRGLKVTLKPHVQIFSPELGYDIVPASIHSGGDYGFVPYDPKAFFDAVEHNLLMHAKIAKENGAWLMMVGTEFGGKLTGAYQGINYNNCSRWHSILSNVRKANSTLKLTYSATFSHWDYLSSNEATRVCFWDALDYIGLNAYANMNNLPIGSKSNDFYNRMFNNGLKIEPQMTDGIAVISNVFRLESFMKTYNIKQWSPKSYIDFVTDGINQWRKAKGLSELKVILTEVGTPSTEAVYRFWGNYGDNTVIDFYGQAEGWDGYLKSLRDDPRIEGINIWGLEPFHERSDTNSVTWLRDYDFNGKPAEKIICKWFSKNKAPLCKF
ncbi:MAG: hypothetical protein RL122_1564 [Pseudomonadota bacterium]|jgi:hypothetical protein